MAYLNRHLKSYFWGYKWKYQETSKEHHLYSDKVASVKYQTNEEQNTNSTHHEKSNIPITAETFCACGSRVLKKNLIKQTLEQL